MKLKLLPSSFDHEGHANSDQRLTSYLIDRCVAIDAGSLAISATEEERESVRDIIITHPHIDHIASLPLFIDELFSRLEQPIRIHATTEVITILERDIFNWTIYPRFSELRNDSCAVMEYLPFRIGEEFTVAHLRVTAVPVNHLVPTVGLLISDGRKTLAFGSDTAETDHFWSLINGAPVVDALLMEASFPNELQALAQTSRHLTPVTLSQELLKLRHQEIDVFVVHIKPAYRSAVVQQLAELKIARLHVMEPGKEYDL